MLALQVWTSAEPQAGRRYYPLARATVHIPANEAEPAAVSMLLGPLAYHGGALLLQENTLLCERRLRSCSCSMSARALPLELSPRLSATRLRHGEQRAGEESR